MKPRRNWAQFAISWLPLWAFFALGVVVMHPGTRVDIGMSVALHMILTAAPLGAIVFVYVGRYQWPTPFRASAIVMHGLFAIAFAVAWVVLIALVDTMMHQRVPANYGPAGIPGYLFVGVWIYSVIAGLSYATHAGERLARAEASAAKSQLSTLRTQLNPHFLFNALHAVVQLIPIEPARASQAAEHISDLLRTAIDEDRDLIPLREEMAFVRQYLGMEQFRFGDRLTLRFDVDASVESLAVPSFGIHCLVENAVRHGVERTIGATEIAISASASSGVLTIVVHDTGRPTGPRSLTAGTGLARLRERLGVLFGARATLAAEPLPSGDFESRLVIPAQTAAD